MSFAGESSLQHLRATARPLETPADLDPLLEHIGDARFVLLGEASHGTAEFYDWRAQISRRLIEEKGFAFVAVEGDWPDCYTVNRFVKGLDGTADSALEVLHAFARWPTWMWANREVAAFTDWLRDFNAARALSERIGFHGLDVYSLWESMAAVIAYLDDIDPDAARMARDAYRCFDPYYEDAQAYARATAFVPTSCEEETVRMLRELRSRAPLFDEDGRDAFFNAEQNALVARNAEKYYRAMIRGGPASWNVRDWHMMETLDRLAAHYGPVSKAIVWAHNTHIGDARFTDMASHGMVNAGQIVREAYGEGPKDRQGTVLVGFGTHRGTVIAAKEWGDPMQRMRMPHAREGSWEEVLHAALHGDALFLFDGSDDGGVPGLDRSVDHRAVGVVYNPYAERWGNYVPTIVPRRYDAFLFIDETTGVSPLHLQPVMSEVPETFPSGM